MGPSPETTPQPSERQRCTICEKGFAVAKEGGDDGPVAVCYECIYQFTDWADRPELIDYEIAKALSAIHADIVELHNTHTVVATPFGLFPTGESHLHWHWNEENFVAGKPPIYSEGAFVASPEHPTPYPECLNRGCTIHRVGE